MILSEIFEVISNVITWQGIKEFFSIIGDICLFLVTMYTFRVTILPMKLRYIGFSQTMDAFQGESVEITLANQSLSPVVVERVGLIHEDRIIPVFVQGEDGECIIEGFKTAKIKMKPFSTISMESKHITLKDIKPFELFVQTTKNVQFITFSPKHRWAPKRKGKELLQAHIQRRCVNDVTIGPQVKYVLTYMMDNRQLKTVLINRAGIMSDRVFGYNALPKDTVKFDERVRAYFKNEFEKRGIEFSLMNLDAGFWEDGMREVSEVDGCIN